MGAADTSDNERHLSIVIGSKESIKAIHKSIGFTRIHMRDMTSDEKEKVIKNLHVNGDIRIFCFSINRAEIVKRVHKQLLKKKRREKKFVEMKFNDSLITKIRNSFEPFLVEHQLVLENIAFECDNDMRRTLSRLGFDYSEPDLAHQLTDVVAYCNYIRRKLYKVSEKDLTMKLESECRKRCGIK